MCYFSNIADWNYNERSRTQSSCNRGPPAAYAWSKVGPSNPSLPRIFRRNANRLTQFELAMLPLNPRGEHLIVVGEGNPPFPRHRALQVMRLALHRGQRIEVVSLVPGTFHV